MISLLRRYLRPEIRLSSGADLREGPAIVSGVTCRPEQPLVTPFRQVRCVAYSYTASSAMRMRQGTVQNKVREVVAYGAFPLRLSDGTIIQAVPASKTQGMTPEEHRELQSSGLEGFVVEETPVRVDRKVQLEGMIVKVGEGWELRYKLLSDVGAAPEEAKGPAPARRGGGKKK
jgi:hypothetical protein